MDLEKSTRDMMKKANPQPQGRNNQLGAQVWIQSTRNHRGHEEDDMSEMKEQLVHITSGGTVEKVSDYEKKIRGPGRD